MKRSAVPLRVVWPAPRSRLLDQAVPFRLRAARVVFLALWGFFVLCLLLAGMEARAQTSNFEPIPPFTVFVSSESVACDQVERTYTMPAGAWMAVAMRVGQGAYSGRVIGETQWTFEAGTAFPFTCWSTDFWFINDAQEWEVGTFAMELRYFGLVGSDQPTGGGTPTVVSLKPFDLSTEDGASIAGAILGVWFIAWGLRAAVRVLSAAGGGDEES